MLTKLHMEYLDRPGEIFGGITERDFKINFQVEKKRKVIKMKNTKKTLNDY